MGGGEGREEMEGMEAGWDDRVKRIGTWIAGYARGRFDNDAKTDVYKLT